MRIIKPALSKVLVIFLFVAYVLFMVNTFPLLSTLTSITKTNYNCELRDPTYAEMKEFLARDKTDLNEYKKGYFFGHFFSYDCKHFSRDLKRNAIKQSIRCAGVIIWRENGSVHAIVAFNTTDRGIIFIEPQTDDEEMIFHNYSIFWPELKK